MIDDVEGELSKLCFLLSIQHKLQVQHQRNVWRTSNIQKQLNKNPGRASELKPKLEQAKLNQINSGIKLSNHIFADHPKVDRLCTKLHATVIHEGSRILKIKIFGNVKQGPYFPVLREVDITEIQVKAQLYEADRVISKALAS